MFKSLFSKKNRNDSLAARNEDENNGSSSDSFAQQPLNEVLNQLYETLDPSDPKGYAGRNCNIRKGCRKCWGWGVGEGNRGQLSH